MLYPTIINDHERINPTKIFGKDAEKVMITINTLYKREMHPFEYGCPRPSEQLGYPMTFDRSKYLSAVDEWKKENEKLLKTLYGISKRHHVRVEWLKFSSVCMPDRWIIRKNGKDIGMIQC